VLATASAGCASSGDDRPEAPAKPAQGSPAASTQASPSPATEPDESDPVEEPAERSGFHGKIDALPAALAAEMRGTTWKPGCPVPLDGLRILHFNYRGFGAAVQRGPMVVNAAVADDVLWVFEQLFDARFPIKRVALATEFHPDRFEQHRRITSHRSVTASFNCRPVVTPLGPGDDYSQHAYGLAAEPYTVRSRSLEGMIHEGDVVVRSFAAIGWEWGGNWSGDKDYMHFSLLGR
jgi:hypothetical protein